MKEKTYYYELTAEEWTLVCKFREEKNKKSPKKKVKILKKKKDLDNLRQQNRLQQMSRKLQNDPPRSERWFLNLFRDHWLESDLFNTVAGPYIPDFINHTFKYVIEIDGTIHDSKIQKQKDLRKNIYFRDLGYSVIRITAYDTNSYEKGVRQILRIREVNNNL